MNTITQIYNKIKTPDYTSGIRISGFVKSFVIKKVLSIFVYYQLLMHLNPIVHSDYVQVYFSCISKI